MRIRVLFLALCALAITAAEPRSAGATELRASGEVVGAAQVDGPRAVWQRPDASIVVRNDQTRTQRTLDAPGCVPLSLRDVLVLLRCTGDEPVLLNVADATRSPVPDWQPMEVYSVLGRYWVAGQDCSSGRASCGTVYRDWRSGEAVTAAGARDLDDPELGALPPTPRRPYVRTSAPRGDEPAERADITLVLTRGTVALSRCRAGCTSITSHSGLVTWLERGRVRGYDLIRRRFASFAAAGFTATDVVHTSRRVYARSGAIATGEPGTLRTARWR